MLERPGPRRPPTPRPWRPPSGVHKTPSGVGPRLTAGIRLKANDVLAERFQITRFIARGGMGDVFEAFDLELGEVVALKTIRPEAAEAEGALERFHREIHLARRVTHPNVCRIFDLFHHFVSDEPDGEITFVTMELLSGQTLAARLKEKGALETKEALPIVAQVVEGLAAAHRAGIVHRDFKSANVLLVPSEHEAGGLRAVVTDFGIARTVSAKDGLDLTLTGAGIILGTPAYMAPEQVEGKPVSPRTDIYALGIVIYEMVTGKRPFAGENEFSTAVQRLKAPPPPPRLHRADLDPRWEAVILRCLERDPERRFASATDVARALLPTPSEGLPAVGAPPRSSRGKLALGAGAAVAAAAMLIAAGRFWGGREKASEAPRLATTQVTASTGLDVFPTFSPDGESIAYSSDKGGTFEIYVKPLAAGGRELQLTADGQQNLEPAWSPDGQRIAYVSKGRGGIWVVPALGGSPKQVTENGSRPAWSPDGGALAYQSDTVADLPGTGVSAMPPSTLWIVPLRGGRARAITKPGTPNGGHGAPVFSPDGKRVVFVAGDARGSSIWSVAPDGQGLASVVADVSYAYDPVFSPDGRFVEYCALSRSSTYAVYRIPFSSASGLPDGKVSELANVGAAPIRQLSASRDGKRVAYSTLTISSNLFTLPLSPETLEPAGSLKALTAETGRNTRPTFSPDGKRLAFNKWRRGATQDVWLMDADGKGAEQVAASEFSDQLPSWFPDRSRLAYLSTRGGQKGYWSASLKTGKETFLTALPASADFPRLSPDGRRVAFNALRDGGTNAVFVAELGGTPRPITPAGMSAGFPCWSPDGELLGVEEKDGDDTQVTLLPVSGGTPTRLTHEKGQSWPYSFSPDGEKVAFAGSRNDVWNVYWVSRKGEERRLTAFTRLNGYVRYPALSPRGDQLVFEYAESTGNIWMLEARP